MYEIFGEILGWCISEYICYRWHRAEQKGAGIHVHNMLVGVSVEQKLPIFDDMQL
jgi:hypothetical protein